METIDITKVKVSNRLRETNEQAVKEIAQSIEDIGLLHPITIDDKNNLVAGAHRLAAFTLLHEKYPNVEKYKMIPFTRPDLPKLGAADKRKIELEENLKRTQMTWQERALGLLEYHRLAQTSSARRGERWTEQQTADLFSVSKTHFNSLKRVAERLKKSKDDPLWSAPNATDAIKILLEEQKAKATKKLAELSKSYRPKDSSEGGERKSSQPIITLGDTDESGILVPTAQSPISVPPYASFYHLGDCLELMEKFKGQFDHIITDSPYGIDMDNFMNEESIKNVKEEHTVEGNLELMEKFFKVAYDCSKDYSFLCVWIDLEHFEKMITWATNAGWIVCRWPVVWCKTSPCINRAAQYNVTKATEFCMIMRKSKSATIATKQQQNFIIAPRDSVSKDHPFGKPYAVWKYLIETVSYEGQTVLDPFAGCGSSLYAIIKLNRKPLAFEIKQEHIINGVNWLERKLNEPRR